MTKTFHDLAFMSGAIALLVSCGGESGGITLPSIAKPPALSLLAGAPGSVGYADGPSSVARFARPSAIVIDTDGNRYVAEFANNTIRRIACDGTVSTVAGQAGVVGASEGKGTAARFNRPMGLALDGAGGLFVADSANHTIRRVVLDTGEVTTVAGLAGDPGTSNRPGAEARFNRPGSLAFHAGRLFIADSLNHAIRVREPDGRVATFAGEAGTIGNAVASTAPGEARFRFPNGVAYRAADNTLFVIDGHNCVIRAVTETAVSVVAGTIGVVSSNPGNNYYDHSDKCGRKDNVDPLAAHINTEFAEALAAAVDANGKVYFVQSDSGGSRLKSFGPTGVRSLSTQNLGFANGPLQDEAKFSRTSGMAIMAGGTGLLLADQGSNQIRRVDLVTRMVSTEAGQTQQEAIDLDGDGPAARFKDRTLGLHLQTDGSLLVGAGGTLREVSAAGQVTTITSAAPPPFSNSIVSIAEAPDGLLFQAAFRLEGIRAGAPVFKVERGSPDPQDNDPFRDGPASAPNPADEARIGCVYGMALDSRGGAVFADRCAFAVRRVTAEGRVRRIAGNYTVQGSDTGDALNVATLKAPIDVAVASNDDIFVLDAGNKSVSKIAPGANGRDVVSLVLANLDDPLALAVGEAGNLYVAEGTLKVIKRIRLNGEVSVIAGQPGMQGFAPGPLPGALAMPGSGHFNPYARTISLKVRTKRLVMTMKKGVVEISPLPE